MQGIFAAFYTFLALKFIPFANLDIVETSISNATSLNSLSNVTNVFYSYFYNLGVFVIGVIIVFSIFCLFKKLYKKGF